MLSVCLGSRQHYADAISVLRTNIHVNESFGLTRHAQDSAQGEALRKLMTTLAVCHTVHVEDAEAAKFQASRPCAVDTQPTIQPWHACPCYAEA